MNRCIREMIVLCLLIALVCLCQGTYDRMEAMLGADIHPVDILLLWAASENDTPKVAELLRAGADVSAKVHERLNLNPA